jgi:hypothetical protein
VKYTRDALERDVPRNDFCDAAQVEVAPGEPGAAPAAEACGSLRLVTLMSAANITDIWLNFMIPSQFRKHGFYLIESSVSRYVGKHGLLKPRIANSKKPHSTAFFAAILPTVPRVIARLHS